MNIGINEFVKRQTRDSRFSHYEGFLEDVAALAYKHFHSCGRQGYRDGVREVDVPSDNFYSGVVQLRPGMVLTGAYESRREGETPRKHVGAIGHKTPAERVTLILYRHDVLAENKEDSTDCEWELVSINARATVEPEPINPDVLMANHFGADGGTATRMTDSEFVAALRTSYEYWKDKAMVEEQP